MPNPLLSVIVPTHSRCSLLKRALESINNQEERNLIEVIVISDIVDSETDLVVQHSLKSSDIYIRRNGIPGPAESRNLGIETSNGKFIMFLDDDDAWQPEFFNQINIKKIKQIENVSYMNCVIIKESRPASGPIKLSESLIETSNALNFNVFVKNQVHMSCYIFNRNLISSIKFDSTLRAYEDWDFQLSVVEREMPNHVPLLCSHVYEVDDLTTDRRGSSTQATDFNAVLDYLTIYRKHPAPTIELKNLRSNLLRTVGLEISPNFL